MNNWPVSMEVSRNNRTPDFQTVYVTADGIMANAPSHTLRLIGSIATSCLRMQSQINARNNLLAAAKHIQITDPLRATAIQSFEAQEAIRTAEVFSLPQDIEEQLPEIAMRIKAGIMERISTEADKDV